MIYSRDVQFDDPRYYRFERNSGLPVGTFPRTERRQWPKVDRIVIVGVIVLGLVAACV